MPPRLSDLDLETGAIGPEGPRATGDADRGIGTSTPAVTTVASGGSSLETDLASQQGRLSRLIAEHERAPNASTTLDKLDYPKGTRFKDDIASEINVVRGTISSLEAQIKAAKAAPIVDKRPSAEIPTGAVPSRLDTKRDTQSKVEQARAAGVSEDVIAAIYGPYGYVPESGAVDPSLAGAGGGGGRGGSSGIAAAGALLRAQLQAGVQNRKINLDTAKAVSKDYFDALSESRQREAISQDAFETAQRANSDYLQTERAKMDLVSPANAKLWESMVNSLGEVSGSPFRVPPEWAAGQTTQVNADVLGGNYAQQQPRDIQALLEGVNRTPQAINDRVLAGAAATNGGAQSAMSSFAGPAFTAGTQMSLEEEAQVDAFLRERGLAPDQVDAIIGSDGADRELE